MCFGVNRKSDQKPGNGLSDNGNNRCHLRVVYNHIDKLNSRIRFNCVLMEMCGVV